jgi:hypothetical protein
VLKIGKRVGQQINFFLVREVVKVVEVVGVNFLAIFNVYRYIHHMHMEQEFSKNIFILVLAKTERKWQI